MNWKKLTNDPTLENYNILVKLGSFLYVCGTVHEVGQKGIYIIDDRGDIRGIPYGVDYIVIDEIGRHDRYYHARPGG